MNCEMIVILCDDEEDARYSYCQFKEYLNLVEPGCIRKDYEACNCVETDDDLRYIFVYHKMVDYFDGITVDITDAGTFFDTLKEIYWKGDLNYGRNCRVFV